jgi:hypothetical protein
VEYNNKNTLGLNKFFFPFRIFRPQSLCSEQVSFCNVPEPATGALAIAIVTGATLRRRRKRRGAIQWAIQDSNL